MTTSTFSSNEKKIITLATLGGMLEFYDFVIYGIFSVYFAEQFFPTHDSLMAIIESYVVFVLGYIARPIGGVIFSHIGDEHGRKRVLVITVILMGISSLGIGLIPNYQTIGILAPILLLCLRLTQGFALGGELPSTYVYIRESIVDKASFAFGITMCGIVAGLLLGMLINFCINQAFTHAQIASFGWRIPFIIGGFLCLISYKIRKQLYETQAFTTINDKPTFPILYLLKHHFAEVIIGTVITAVLAASIVVFVIFMPTYLQKILGLNARFVSIATLSITSLCAISALAIGYLCHHYQLELNRFFSKSLIIGVVLVCLSFYALGNHVVVFDAVLILGIVAGVFTILSPAIITTLFPAKVRLSGVALCYNLGFSIFGGLAPVIITWFIHGGSNKFLVPTVYIVILYILGFISMRFIKKAV